MDMDMAGSNSVGSYQTFFDIIPIAQKKRPITTPGWATHIRGIDDERNQTNS